MVQGKRLGRLAGQALGSTQPSSAVWYREFVVPDGKLEDSAADGSQAGVPLQVTICWGGIYFEEFGYGKPDRGAFLLQARHSGPVNQAGQIDPRYDPARQPTLSVVLGGATR